MCIRDSKIAARKHVGLGGLIRCGVNKHGAALAELELRAGVDAAQVDLLADGRDDGGDGKRLELARADGLAAALLVGLTEGHGLDLDGRDLALFAQDLDRGAQEAELDLVKIAPAAKPPVCKIIDYGKYKYEQARKEKEAKKKQKTVEVKEVRLSPNIDTNDLNTKINNAKKFISKGNKVKVTLRFRGREMAHVQQSKHILDDFAKQLEDVATVEKAAKLEGRNMSMVLAEKR